MKTSGLSKVEVLVMIVVLAALAALVVPALVEAIRAAKITQCTSNLKQIGTLAEIYRKTFGGQSFELPDVTGRARFMDYLKKYASENQDDSVFTCPAAESASADYRWIGLDADTGNGYPKLTLLTLADRCPGGKTQHYGDNTKYGINALTKGYQVTTITDQDSRWKQVLPYLMD